MATRRMRRRKLRTKRGSRKQRGGNNPTIESNEVSHLYKLAEDVQAIENTGNSTYRKNRYIAMKKLLLFVLQAKEVLNDRALRSAIEGHIDDLYRDDLDLIRADPDEMDRKLKKLKMIINEMNTRLTRP
jgi:hypothetical protein